MTSLRIATSGRFARPSDVAAIPQYPAVLGASDGNTFAAYPVDVPGGLLSKVPTFASFDDYRSAAPLADSTLFVCERKAWLYLANDGAGVADDNRYVLKQSSVALISPGRAFLIDAQLNRTDVAIADSASFSRACASGAAFLPCPSNPVSYAMEATYLLDGERLDNWYRDTRDSKIYYAYADDPDSSVWVIGNGGVAISDSNPDLSGTEMPCVQRVGDVYYMIANQGYQLRLLSSVDKVHWSYCDGGVPVLAKSAVLTDWNYRLFNPAFCVVGNEWHLLVEAAPNGGNFTTHYSHATFTGTVDFGPNATALPVFSGATGNACLVYVPDRSALLALYGDVTSGKWVLRASYGLLSSDLSLAASWLYVPGFGLQVDGVHVTDPTIVFGSSKRWRCLLGYNYAQSEGYQASNQLTLNEFFDAVTSPTSAGDNFAVVGNVLSNRVALGHVGDAFLGSNASGSIVEVAKSGLVELMRTTSATKCVQLRINGGDFLIHPDATPGTLGAVYLTLSSAGYLGVGGVSSPACPLHARKPGGANQLVARFDNPSGNAYMELLAGSAACVQFWSTGTGDFAIQTAATPGTVGTQRLYIAATGEIRIGGTGAPNASMLLDLQSTTKGFGPPRMTTAQKTAISSPSEGLLVYDLSLHQMSYYNGTAWVNF